METVRFHIAQTAFFLGDFFFFFFFFSHLVGPSEQFGTHEKLCDDELRRFMPVVCRGNAYLGAGDMLSGHWFPPHIPLLLGVFYPLRKSPE